MNRGRVKTYRLISSRDTDQLFVHYADPKFRKNLRPLCHITGWERVSWEIDPAGGLGADMCKHCLRVAKKWAEGDRKLENARRRRKYRNHTAEERERNRRYKEEVGLEVQRRYRRTYYRRHREEIARRRAGKTSS